MEENNNNNNPDTLVSHLKIIEHNAKALSSRIENFLSGEKHQFSTLSSRLMAYGRNLAKEIESLVVRQDYSEIRYRGLLRLIDDCENHLKSLDNRCTRECSELNARKRLLEPSESNASKKLCENENTAVEQSDGQSFVCPFCSHRIQDKNRKIISNHDIVNHLKCHENKSFQCVKCNAFFASKTIVLNHILLCHAGDRIKYFHNRVATGLEKVSIQLCCNICKIIFKTSDEAMRHYDNNHSAQRMDLNAVPSIETTTFDMQTEWAIGHFAWNIRQQWLCDGCNHPEGTITKLLIHYNKEHPFEALAAKCGKTLVAHSDYENWRSNILYGCAHCHKRAGASNILFDSPKAVYGHWQEKHTKAPDFKPFQFCAVNFVACFHCNRISSFEDMQIHHIKQHSNEPFLVVDINSRRKCGICQEDADDMAKHFTESHKPLDRIEVSDPIRFSCEQLSKLLAIGMHKKIKCGHCNEAFDCSAEHRKHWMARHPNEKTKIHSFFNDERICIVLDCCNEVLERHRLGEHFVEHSFRFHCTICDFVTSKLRRILQHDQNKHAETYDGQRRISNFAKKLKGFYCNGKIIFGNGFVATGFNLLDTEYDDSHLIDDFVSAFKSQESD